VETVRFAGHSRSEREQVPLFAFARSLPATNPRVRCRSGCLPSCALGVREPPSCGPSSRGPRRARSRGTLLGTSSAPGDHPLSTRPVPTGPSDAGARPDPEGFGLAPSPSDLAGGRTKGSRPSALPRSRHGSSRAEALPSPRWGRKTAPGSLPRRGPRMHVPSVVLVPRRELPPSLRSAFAVSHDLDGLPLSGVVRHVSSGHAHGVWIPAEIPPWRVPAPSSPRAVRCGLSPAKPPSPPG
jgi:hypothetical protein